MCLEEETMLPHLWERIEHSEKGKNNQRRTVVLGGLSRSHSAEEIQSLKKQSWKQRDGLRREVSYAHRNTVCTNQAA